MTLRDWRGGRIKKRMNVPISFTDLGSSKSSFLSSYVGNDVAQPW